jgi:hypothetical protein
MESNNKIFLKKNELGKQSDTRRLNTNIDYQIEELINLKDNPLFLESTSAISLARLKNYVETKIDEYKSWNGEWF